MLAAESAALPLASIRNGPISQSEGMARTTKKTKIRPAKNSRKPNRRRRRRFDSSREPGSRVNGAAVTTAPSGTKMVSAVVTTGSTGAAGGTGAASWTAGVVVTISGWIVAGGVAPPPVSLSSRACSFA